MRSSRSLVAAVRTCCFRRPRRDRASRASAASFIAADVFDRWRAQHPEWHVIERAEARTGFPMIEVPIIELAGHRIGPVWFTRRNSTDFHRLMDPLMDAPIEGAIGGSALRYVRVTIDYPRALACFTRVD